MGAEQEQGQAEIQSTAKLGQTTPPPASGLTLRRDGKPWPRKQGAKAKATQLTKSTGILHDLVQVEGGWALRPREDDIPFQESSYGARLNKAIEERDERELWELLRLDSNVRSRARFFERTGIKPTRTQRELREAIRSWVAQPAPGSAPGAPQVPPQVPPQVALLDNANAPQVAQGTEQPQGGAMQPQAEAPAQPVPTPGMETDPARVQEIRNSIAEGEMILESGRNTLGRKMSPSEIGAVRRSVENAKAKVGGVLPQAPAPAVAEDAAVAPALAPTMPQEAPSAPAPAPVSAEAGNAQQEGRGEQGEASAVPELSPENMAALRRAAKRLNRGKTGEAVNYVLDGGKLVKGDFPTLAVTKGPSFIVRSDGSAAWNPGKGQSEVKVIPAQEAKGQAEQPAAAPAPTTPPGVNLKSTGQPYSENAIRLVVDRKVSQGQNVEAVEVPGGWGWREIQDEGPKRSKKATKEIRAALLAVPKAEDGTLDYDAMAAEADRLMDKAGYSVDDVNETLAEVTEEGESKGSIRFSRAQSQGQGMKAKDLAARLAPTVARWPGAPKVTVVQSMKNLPVFVWEAMADSADSGNNITRGLYWNGEAWIVADHVESEADAGMVLVHEVVRHHGVKSVLGAEYRQFMNRAWLNPDIRARVEQKVRPEGGYDHLADLSDKANRNAAIEEVLADIGDQGVKHRWYDKWVALIRDALRRMFPKWSGKVTNAEVRNLIRSSAEYVTGGGKRDARAGRYSVERSGEGWAVRNEDDVIEETFSSRREAEAKAAEWNAEDGETPKDPLFSRLSASTSGVPLASVESAVKPLQSMAVNAVGTRVVQTTGDVPPRALNRFRRQGGGFLEAIYDEETRTAYMVADNISSESRAVAVWLHAQGLHVGLPGIFNNEIQFRNLLDEIGKSIPRQDRQDIAGLYLKDKTARTLEDRLILAEEYMARVAEKVSLNEVLAPREQTIWQRVVRYFRSFLRRHGVKVRLSQAEIAEIVHDAVRWTVTGKTRGEARRLYQEVLGEALGYPTMGAGGIRFSRAAPSPSTAAAFTPEVEARWQEARRGIADRRTLLRRTHEAITSTAARFAYLPDLPKTAELAEAREIIRQFEAAPSVAKSAAVRMLKNITGNLSRAEYDLFSRKVLLDDLAVEVEREHELPFGFTPESVAAAKAEVDRMAGQSDAVQAAVKLRAAALEKTKKALLDAGVMTEEQFSNPSYFRHQVLEYAMERQGTQGASRVRRPRPGYAKKREGSTLDINANYLEAEFEYLHRALIDVVASKTIDRLREKYDKRPEALAQAKKWNEGHPGQPKRTWKDFIPAGYAAWSPEKGSAFFTGKSTTERAIGAALDAIQTEGLEGVTREEIEDVLRRIGDAEAKRGKMLNLVVPEALATTLGKMTTNVTRGWMDEVFRTPMRLWKQWVLINPRRVVKYNLNNLSGDLDAVIAGSPKALRRMPQAVRELYAVMKGGEPTARMQEAIDRGVFDTGLTIQEIPEINALDEFRGLRGQLAAKDMPIEAARRIWRALKDFTQFRENWLRYAAYLDYAERLEGGESMRSIGYGAAYKPLVDGLTDTKDKAALLARELVGDYGAVSEIGQELRTKLIPFYSWCVPAHTEILTMGGWKKKDEISVGEFVLTYNMERRETEWQPVEDVAEYQFDGDLVTLSNAYGFKYQFTEDHRVVVIEKYGDKRKMVLAKDLKTHHHIPIVAPHTFTGESILSPKEAALLGWLVTDGYSRVREHSPNSFEAMLYQKKPDMVEKIRREFGEYITSESVHPTTGTICFRLGAKTIERIRAVYSIKEDLPGVVTRLSREACEAMYQAMLDAEGTSCNGFVAFPQNEGPVLDAFQVLAYLLGKAGHIRSKKGQEHKSIYVKNRDKIQLYKWENTREHYSGVVWCPQTPNGTWVMRQNGKVMITGNCEINTRRYMRLFNNAAAQGIGQGLKTAGTVGALKGARLTAWLGVRSFVLCGLVQLWNNLMFPDLEDELDANQRARLHLTLGRDKDGNVLSLRFQGALSDFFSWIGLEDAAGVLVEVEKGRAGYGDLLKTIGKAPVNKIVGGVTPLIRTPVEMAAKRSFWPDVFNPRVIRDREREFARLFSLENERDWLRGAPSRGYWRSWVQGVVSEGDPREMAFNSIRGKKYDWMRRVLGKDGSGDFSSPRSEALRQWRMALKFGDREAVARTRKKLREMGVDGESLRRSIKSQDPLYGLNARDRQRFLGTLSPSERKQLELARRFYRETYLQGGAASAQ